MANDTSISRLSTESNTSAVRKKANSESIDVSKLSFFEELLTIGKFESTVPDALSLPVQSAPISESDSSSRAEPESNEGSFDEKSDSSQDAEPETLVTAGLVQQQLNPQPQPFAPDRDQEQGDGPNTTEASQPTQESPTTRTETSDEAALPSNTLAEPGQSLSEGNRKSEKLRQESNATDSDQSLAVGEIVNDSTGTQDADVTQSIQVVSATTKSSEQQEHRQSSRELAKKSQTKADSNARRSDTHSGGVNEDRVQENDAVSGVLPRNKRAERLAKIASESSPISDDRSSQAELSPTQGPDSKPSEVERQTNIDGVTSTSIAATSPTIAPTVIASPIPTSINVTTTAQRPSSESNSAIVTSTTRGSLPSNDANTTFSSSPTNPSRAELGRGEVARSSGGNPITAYQEAKLVQRVLRGVEQLANGGGQVRLRLHPPELGSLQLSLRMEAGQVFAKLEVENSTARDALLNNVQSLKDKLAEQGMKVSAFEVEVSTDSSGSGTAGSNFQGERGSGSESRWNNATSRFAQQNNNRLTSEPPTPDRKLGTNWSRTDGSLDLTV